MPFTNNSNRNETGNIHGRKPFHRRLPPVGVHPIAAAEAAKAPICLRLFAKSIYIVIQIRTILRYFTLSHSASATTRDLSSGELAAWLYQKVSPCALGVAFIKIPHVLSATGGECKEFVLAHSPCTIQSFSSVVWPHRTILPRCYFPCTLFPVLIPFRFFLPPLPPVSNGTSSFRGNGRSQPRAQPEEDFHCNRRIMSFVICSVCSVGLTSPVNPPFGWVWLSWVR